LVSGVEAWAASLGVWCGAEVGGGGEPVGFDPQRALDDQTVAHFESNQRLGEQVG